MRRPDLGLLVVLLLTLGFYARALGNHFAQDDVHMVQVLGTTEPPNPMVAAWQGLPAYFQNHYWHGIYPKGDLYRPVTVLSYAATYALCGDRLVSEAFPHHLGNVLLHLAATVLVFLLLGQLGVPRPARRLATAVFALHAVRSEAVAGIVGRAELLVFVGGAFAAWLLVASETWRGGRRLAGLAAAAVALFVAYGSKESGLAWAPFLPCLVLARGHSVGRTFATTAVVAALPLVAYLLLRAQALAGLEPPPTLPIVNPLVALGAGERLATALVIQLHALWKTLVPLGLVCEYGIRTFTMRTGFSDPVALGAGLAQAALVGYGLLSLRRRPLVFLAVAAFFGFGFLTANLAFPTGVVFAERLLYVPALGLSFALAALAAWRWLPLLTVALLLPSMFELWQRVPVWKDDRTLFTTDVARNPDAVRLLTSAAKVLRDDGLGEIERAIGYLRRSVEIAPEYALGWNNLGALLLDAGRPADAVPALERGMQATLRTPGEDAFRLHANLGAAHLRLGRRDEAIPLLRRATELMPGFRPAWIDLFTALDEPARATALDAELERAARLVPDDPRAAFYRGVRALDRNHSADALRALAFSFQAEPEHWPTSLAFAEALVREGRRSEARELLQRMARSPRVPEPVRAKAQQNLAAIPQDDAPRK